MAGVALITKLESVYGSNLSSTILTICKVILSKEYAGTLWSALVDRSAVPEGDREIVSGQGVVS